MQGQWIGEYSGSNRGVIIVNVDEFPSYFEGFAYINDSNPKLASTAAFFRTADKRETFKFRTLHLGVVDPRTGLPDTWNNVRHLYPDSLNMPLYADVEGSWNETVLTLSWRTNIETHGACTLPRSKADQPSDLVPVQYNWAQFKSELSSPKGRRFIFRGQNGPSRLRTAFHRSGRANLQRFITTDIQTLHRRLSARTKHVFNLEIPVQNGAFFNLVQHHGYPTPLLDWTYSPYVAAFFAYRGISNSAAAKADPTDKVRIYVFDQDQWSSDYPQLFNLAVSSLHVSISEFIAIDNERMIPQQATSTVTNVDDIEAYIRSKEFPGKTYLSAIDLPKSERKQVIEELSYMGITAGSLFPGLDGACEELKERFFEI